LIITCFFFYFLGGYLFYAALFAAVGSVVNEDPQEAQSLMLPITMPIILGFILLSSTVSHPTSSTAFWGSMIPFTSPIVMMGRVANGVPDIVPWWQLFLSMGLLVIGFMFTTWFAGKIYRTGILLYGKRATWREMIKWLRRSS
jgi:ABC-2 type transport system permease protein